VPGLSLSLLVCSTQAVLDSTLNGSADIGILSSGPQKIPARSLCTMKNPVGLALYHRAGEGCQRAREWHRPCSNHRLYTTLVVSKVLTSRLIVCPLCWYWYTS